MQLTHHDVTGGSSATLKNYFLATRPMFFVAPLLPLMIGSAIGYKDAGIFDWPAFLLALVSVFLITAATNVFNDVYDEISGTDRINTARIHPFTGGSRFIQNGIFSLEQMRHYGVLLLMVSALFGFGLVLLKGYIVLLFGLAGVFMGIGFSAPPFKFAAHGLGEGAVALGVGILPLIGAAWLQSGYFSFEALILAIPVGLWVANILLINEIPDAQADETAGKRTLVVRLGHQYTAGIYLSANVLAYFLVYAAMKMNYIHFITSLLPVLSLLPAAYACSAIMNWEKKPEIFKNAIKATLAIHILNCVWLFTWVLISNA